MLMKFSKKDINEVATRKLQLSKSDMKRTCWPNQLMLKVNNFTKSFIIKTWGFIWIKLIAPDFHVGLKNSLIKASSLLNCLMSAKTVTPLLNFLEDIPEEQYRYFHRHLSGCE